MKPSILFSIDSTILALMLFIGCLSVVMLGKKAREKFLSSDEHESRGGVNSLLAALFGLWGFLLAFTFGSAFTRFENVRGMMAEEANVIRNVILRVETLPDSTQSAFKEDVKKYLQARIDYYEYAGNLEHLNKTKRDVAAIGKNLWMQTVSISRVPNFTFPASNMLAALTDMYDIAARRDAILMSGIPTPISIVLFFIALVISFVGGFTTPIIRLKEWVVITGFTMLACLIILITLDMARPMRGLIRPDAGQQKIIQLKGLF